MNRNDAFSSLRICSYNKRIGSYHNFLRLRLAADGFDVYAVGLEVPHRDDWIANAKHNRERPDPDQPVFVPTGELEPRFDRKDFHKIRDRQGPTYAGRGALRNERTRRSAADGRRLRSDL
jgi:hypothetical protein